MLKSTKKVFGILCAMCVLFMTITTIGSAAWYFFSVVEAKQETGQVGDALRPNQSFGDHEDVVLKNLEFYDVYFLAQHTRHIERDFLVPTGETIDGKPNYQFKDLSKGIYYKNEIPGVPEGDLRFGSWGSTARRSQYYKKVSNVETITNSILDLIGKPTCHLVDANSDLNGQYYVLQFSAWTVDPYEHDIYARSDGHTMNNDYIQVYGTYPFEGFEIAYFNTLLSYYDDSSIYINGRKTLFFYPIYTVGKGYYVSRGTGETKNLRDSLTLMKSENEEGFFTFDEKYTNLMKSASSPMKDEYVDDEGQKPIDSQTRYLAYRYVDYIINEDEINNTNCGYVVNHIDEVNGSWMSDKKNITRHSSNVFLNKEAGRFNIYIFVKEKYLKKNSISSRDEIDPSKDIVEPEFTTDEKTFIQNILDAESLSINSFYECDMQSICKTNRNGILDYDHFCDTRDYIIALEKKYEPRLIGGNTGEFNYLSEVAEKKYMTQNGLNGEEKCSYDLRGVSFYCEDDKFDYIDFSSKFSTSRRKMRIPNYYFAIQLSRATNVRYEQKVCDDSISITDEERGYKRPVYKYYKETETGMIEEIEEFQSSSILISLRDAINNDLANAENGLPLKYKDIERVQITKMDPSQDPTYYSIGEYIRRGKNGEEGFTDWEALMDLFNLVRPKGTGNYNIFAHVTFHNNPDDDSNSTKLPSSVDIWAYRLHNIFVNIYDPEDFDNQTIMQFNGSYIREDALTNYSFRCKYYYYLDTDFLYEENGSYKEFVSKKSEPIPGLTEVNGTYDIYSILQYYDSKGKCLQDMTSGRYITLENCKTNPFIIRKNYVLLVVDKP